MSAFRISTVLLYACVLLVWKTVVSFAATEGLKFPSKLEGHGGPVKSVTISHDGKTALSASFDYTVILWRLDGMPDGSDAVLKRLVGHNAAVNDVAFLANGRAVSVGDDGKVILWDLNSGKPLKQAETGPERLLQLDVSDDGRLLAVAKWDGTARVFDLDNLELISWMEGHRARVNTVAFSPDATILFSGAYDGTINMWETQTGKLIRPVYSHGWGINTIQLVENGTALVFGATQGTLAKIDIESGELVRQFAKFERPVQALTVSHDGLSIASGGGDGYIHLYNVATGQQEEEYLATYGPVWDMAFGPDDTQMLHAGLDDFIISWTIAPRAKFEKVVSTYPRRFQQARSDDPGELEFHRKCSVCHTLEPDGKNRAGPTLFGLFGRKAGSVKDYPYSEALLKSDIIWNEKTIGQLFDEGPDIVTPGTKMPIQRLKSVTRRDELIRFLKTATKSE